MSHGKNQRNAQLCIEREGVEYKKQNSNRRAFLVIPTGHGWTVCHPNKIKDSIGNTTLKYYYYFSLYNDLYFN